MNRFLRVLPIAVALLGISHAADAVTRGGKLVYARYAGIDQFAATGYRIRCMAEAKQRHGDGKHAKKPIHRKSPSACTCHGFIDCYSPL